MHSARVTVAFRGRSPHFDEAVGDAVDVAGHENVLAEDGLSPAADVEGDL